MNQANETRAAHAGWKTEEESLLFTEVEHGRESGRPLKAVFDAVAKKTGRRPNSIRNYYYLKIKQDENRAACAARCTAFVPFTDAEIRSLLRTVLTEQARGISVRACTLQMGGGDNKAMLRYQNKYRSLIKNNPELVHEVVAELRSEGIRAIDPCGETPTIRRAGRPRKSSLSLVDVMSTVVNDLDKVEGLDVVAFFENLGTLAISAAKGAALKSAEEAIEGGENELARAREQNAELRAQLRSRENELTSQRERFNALLSLHRQLMNVNREFLGMTGVVKMSSLSSYIRDLSRNVEDCERLLPEYVK